MKEDKENDLKFWQFAEIIKVKLVNFLKNSTSYHFIYFYLYFQIYT